jgi:hypothetical protein
MRQGNVFQLWGKPEFWPCCIVAVWQDPGPKLLGYFAARHFHRGARAQWVLVQASLVGDSPPPAKCTRVRGVGFNLGGVRCASEWAQPQRCTVQRI